MTDWDLIVAHIQNAMQAVDQAQEASENLRNNSSVEAFDDFKSQMQELSEHLSALKHVMEHSSAYTLEELVDALSRMQSGKPAPYRRTQHIGE